MSRRPHENTELARYIDRRVLELKAKKSQAEIAAEAGYVNQNMITIVNERSKLTRFQRLDLTHLMWCKAPSRAALT